MRLRPRAQAEESAKCSHLLVIARRLVQLASAAIYAALIPDLSFGTALYHCFVTASTVGYGDVAITTPEARLFACLHIVVSVSWLAALLSSVDTLRKQRESQLQRVETRPEVGSATHRLAVPHTARPTATFCDWQCVAGCRGVAPMCACSEPRSNRAGAPRCPRQTAGRRFRAWLVVQVAEARRRQYLPYISPTTPLYLAYVFQAAEARRTCREAAAGRADHGARPRR